MAGAGMAFVGVGSRVAVDDWVGIADAGGVTVAVIVAGDGPTVTGGGAEAKVESPRRTGRYTFKLSVTSD